MSDSLNCHVTIAVPGEAVGLIIKNITMLRALKGMQFCTLQSVAGELNRKVLVMKGSYETTEFGREVIMGYIKQAKKQLSNGSRKNHSWTLTTNGHLLTPREVHHTGQSKPKLGHRSCKNHHDAKKQAKRIQKQKEIAANLRRRLEREG